MRTTKNISTGMLLGVLSFALLSFDLPKGWFKAGSASKSYDMGIDNETSYDGKNAVTIKSNEKKIRGFGTLMQTCLPDNYIGRRVRMSGYMKSKNVDDKAGLWFRVDQKGSKIPLAFDNMQDRPVTKTSDWKKYEIVLDVPINSSRLAYGALLVGTGQIWFSNLNFEIVDSTVATTGRGMKDLMPGNEPNNLNFEK